jgi:hypothetical protein
MLNIAIDPDTPFWLICPYDAVTLSPAVVEEAHRSHPVIVDAASYHGSAHYSGRAQVVEFSYLVVLAAELCVADRLASGPRSIADLSAATGAESLTTGSCSATTGGGC